MCLSVLPLQTFCKDLVYLLFSFLHDVWSAHLLFSTFIEQLSISTGVQLSSERPLLSLSPRKKPQAFCIIPDQGTGHLPLEVQLGWGPRHAPGSIPSGAGAAWETTGVRGTGSKSANSWTYQAQPPLLFHYFWFP